MSTDITPREALRVWIDADPERSQSTLARTLGVSQPSVSAWLAGTSRPEAHHREALELLTGIPADAWKTDVERALVARTRAAVEAARNAAAPQVAA